MYVEYLQNQMNSNVCSSSKIIPSVLIMSTYIKIVMKSWPESGICAVWPVLLVKFGSKMRLRKRNWKELSSRLQNFWHGRQNFVHISWNLIGNAPRACLVHKQDIQRSFLYDYIKRGIGKV